MSVIKLMPVSSFVTFWLYVLGELFRLFVSGDFCRLFFLEVRSFASHQVNMVMFASFPRASNSLRIIKMKFNGTEIMR